MKNLINVNFVKKLQDVQRIDGGGFSASANDVEVIFKLGVNSRFLAEVSLTVDGRSWDVEDDRDAVVEVWNALEKAQFDNNHEDFTTSNKERQRLQEWADELMCDE